MMSKLCLPLTLVSAVAVFSGCAHQSTRYGSKTNLLLGAVQIERGNYANAPIASLDGNWNEMFGNMGRVSGTQVKLGWGVLAANDY